LPQLNNILFSKFCQTTDRNRLFLIKIFDEIGLDHYIAKGAINKKTGDTFVTNHPQKKTWSIQEIVSKYVKSK
jgi:hypothetical protein